MTIETANGALPEAPATVTAALPDIARCLSLDGPDDPDTDGQLLESAEALVSGLARDPKAYCQLIKAVQDWQLAAHAGHQKSSAWVIARAAPAKGGEVELLRYDVGAGARVQERWTPNPMVAHRFESLDEAAQQCRLTLSRIPGTYWLMRVEPTGAICSVPLMP